MNDFRQARNCVYLKFWVQILMLLALTSSFVFARDNVLSLSDLVKAWPNPIQQQPFKETRYDSVLDLTSQYKGYFLFKNTSDFSVVYQSPIEGVIALHGKTVSVSLPSKKISISLNQLPQLATFIHPVIAILGGEITPLMEGYNIKFSKEKESQSKGLGLNDGRKWVLNLTPKAHAAFSAQEMVIKGQEISGKVSLSLIRLSFSSGDWREFKLVKANAR